MSFLGYHTDRYQSLYVLPDGAEDLGLSTWQGVPPQASTTGFAIGADNGFLTWNGIGDAWWVCPQPNAPLPDTYVVRFAKQGKNMTGCANVDLKTEGYGRCVEN